MAVHQNAKQIAKHVAYELWMFREAINRLRSSRGKVDQFQNNLLIEAILVHARVVYEFLFSPHQERYPKDVRAGHFFDSHNEWKQDSSSLCPYLNKNLDRMNRSLHHISYDRLEYERNKLWNITTIETEISDAWDCFYSLLPAERQQWFQNNGS